MILLNYDMWPLNRPYFVIPPIIPSASLEKPSVSLSWQTARRECLFIGRKLCTKRRRQREREEDEC